jgi:SWIM zinc finger
MLGDYLYPIDSNDILEALRAVTDKDIRDCADFQVYLRGREYFEDGMVERLDHYSSNNTVLAEVIGSAEYQVDFYLGEKGVYASCDCPYHDVCKHTVAALLCILHEGIHSGTGRDIPMPSYEESLDFLKRHLGGYSKAELVQLVMRFAPQSYITEVHNREVRNVDADSIVEEAERNISGYFEEDRLLYDPDGMEAALMVQLNDIKGLEARVQDKLGSLLIRIIREVEDAFNKGYLCEDHRGYENNFESDEFCEYVIAFVRKLPFAERIAYIPDLDKALNEMSYTTFNPIADSYARFFDDKERAALKTRVSGKPGYPDTIISRLYPFIEPELTTLEKEAILRRIKDKSNEHFISLCLFLQQQERYREAFEMISEHLNGRNYLMDARIVLVWLESAYKLDILSEELAIRAVEKSPRSEVLRRVSELKGLTNPAFEDIVLNWQPLELLSYFEQEQRMSDALNLVLHSGRIMDTSAMKFFDRHRATFPAEAAAFLEKRIRDNLEQAGNSYYSRVLESLELLIKVDSARAHGMAVDIRANFRRRPKLLAMIGRY